MTYILIQSIILKLLTKQESTKIMAKFSRFDPRNKKNGRHKKMSKEAVDTKGKMTGKSYFDEENEKYMKKYRKYIEDELY